ncbi:hypothetical protein DPMN_144795 [Dreissena polymorpha]|uniref:BACK domain-containing protein n=1 Tax=Dreissena polymorpha TaxID=45954 RepID=A0A9D4F8N2_DREPO|nr:hypothetical protein DPMN_144795 [Dreissena polymorpha]
MVDLTNNTVMHILYAAKKYDVPDLQSKCRSFLSKIMSTKNISITLNQAIDFDDSILQTMCLDFIVKQSDGVLKSDSFVEMSRSALKAVLMCDTFGVSEDQLFLACKRWAQHACESAGREVTDENLRQTLGEDLVNLIRFPAMPMKEFSEYVATGTFLSQTETLNEFRSIAERINMTSFNNRDRITSNICITSGTSFFSGPFSKT